MRRSQRQPLRLRLIPGGAVAPRRNSFWPRIQVRDASYSLTPTKTQSISFVDNGQGRDVAESPAPGKAAQRGSSDAGDYRYGDIPEAGVKIPKGLGVRIVVNSMSSETMALHVDDVW